jgi:UDP-N-acetylmuramoyl-tripeptide--D-alanyl-D-alanine ligase
MKQTILLTAHEIELVTGGKWRNLPDGYLDITGVNFNPRRVTEGDLFIVRNWKTVDGTDAESLVGRAFNQGAVAAVVQAGDIKDSDYPLLEVADPYQALRDMAASSSLKYGGLRILVTGSHGKTGFKTQLYHLIRKQTSTHANIDSGNKEAAIWRALASIPRGTKVFIVEVAVPSRSFGEKGATLIRPNYCVITGIGLEHLRSHKTLNNLIRNKAGTVTGLRPGGKCLLNADDEYYAALRSEVKNLSTCDILTFGSAPSCHGRLLEAGFNESGWRVRADILEEIIEYDLPLLENYAPLASVSVLLTAKLLGADLRACAAEYADYRNFESSGNMYWIKTAKGNILVYDQSRRGELKGFESMFELMSRLQPRCGGRKIAVVSEFINLDDNPGITVDTGRMRSLMEAAGIGILFTVQEFKRYEEAVPADVEWRLHGDTYEDIREDLLHTVRENDMVFIRGVLSAKMYNLVRSLLNREGNAVEKIY